MKKLFILLLCIPFLSSAQEDLSVLYKLERLSDSVNTRYHETAPLVTSDNQRLYFTVSNHPDNNKGTDNTQDIWYSDKRPDGTWGKAKHMPSPLNNRKFNQVLTILDGGNTLFIRGGDQKKEEGFSFTFRQGKNDWSKPQEVDIKGFEDMNNGRFSGAVISQDRSTIVIYMSERTNKAYSDLYVSKLQPNGKYTKPEMITSLSTPQDEFGQYLTNNDKTMYFASNRPGGLGGVDVWKTQRLDDTWQNWSEPVNIGEPINTGGFDSYFSVDATGKNAFTTRTYVSADGSNINIYGLVPRPKIIVKGTITDAKSGETVTAKLQIKAEEEEDKLLTTGSNGAYEFKTNQEKVFFYFATADGYLNQQDTLDLTKIDRDTTIIKNMVMDPIPAEIILYGKVIDAKENMPASVYVKTAKGEWQNQAQTKYEDGSYRMKLNGVGPYTITIDNLSFNPVNETLNVQLEEGVYYKEIQKDFMLERALKPYVISGYVYDEKTKDPLSAKISIDLNDSVMATATSTEDGYYYAEVKQPGDFKIRASKEDYLNLEESITIHDNQDFVNYTKDLYMIPIEIGATVIIKNIYFNFDKTTLKPESYPELNRLTDLMKTNEGITIEIAGHTDDKGSDEYNLTLSDGRAKSVMDYLLEQGIEESRMVAKGYGEAKPIASNYSDEGRSANRRVEFTILSK